MSAAPAIDHATPDGVHHGMTEEAYDRIPAMRSTVLRVLIDKSPAHARYVQMHGTKEGPAKVFGRLLHLALLEPDRAERELMVQPYFGDQRYKENKAAKAEWLLENPLPPGVLDYVDQETRDQMLGMRDSAYAHPVLGEMMRARGRNEVSCVWTDPSGVRCKVRIDRMFEWDRWLSLLDAKSTKDASPWSFARDVHNYGYHIQAALYLRALNELHSVAHRPFFICALEKEPPYGVMLYELGKDDLALGRTKVDEGLQLWGDCLKKNWFPGYPGHIHDLRLPAYAYKSEGAESDPEDAIF